MATIVTDKHLKGPPNQTFENVAEEMLNGMFCHYEPPDPKRKKHRGILKTPKLLRRNNKQQQQQAEEKDAKRGIRWSDTVEASFPKPQAVDIHCNVARSCVDGCTEAGILNSPTKQEKAQEIAAKYDYEKLMKAREDDDAGVVEEDDDDDFELDNANDEEKHNNKRKKKKSPPPPPPPPPPPSKTNHVLAEFCGVEIKCGDEGDVHTDGGDSAKPSATKPYRRPKQPYDEYYDDGDNSIAVDDDDDDDDDDDTNDILNDNKLKSDYSRASNSPTDSLSCSSFVDYANRSNDDITSPGSSFLGSLWPSASTGKRRPSSSSRDKSNDTSAVEKDDDDEADPITMIRSLDSSSMTSSPVNKKDDKKKGQAPAKTQNKHDSIKAKENVDWDVSVLDGGKSKKKKEKAASPRTSRWSLGRSSKNKNKKQQKNRRASSPGPLRPRSRSKERLSLDSLPRNVTTVKPSRTSSNDSAVDSDHALSLMDHARAVIDHSRARQDHNMIMHDHEKLQGNPAAFPKMHPAHPLSRDNSDGSVADAMERRSFITAHRQGFGDGMSDANNAVDAKLDDRMERQSFITASRGTDDFAIPPPPPQHLEPISNQFDRQSYITNHRRAMELSPRQQIKWHQQQQQQQRGRSPVRQMRSISNSRQSPGRRGRSRSSSPHRRRGRSLDRQNNQVPRSQSLEREIRRNQAVIYGAPALYQQQHMGFMGHPAYATNMPPQSATQSQMLPQSNSMPILQHNHSFASQQDPRLPHSKSIPPGPFQSTMPQQGYIQQQLSVVQEEKQAYAQKQEEQDVDSSWEARTREAWERLRGGVISTLSNETLDTPCKPLDTCKLEDAETMPQEHAAMLQNASSLLSEQPSLQTQPSLQMQLPMMGQQQVQPEQSQQQMPTQPVGILRNVDPDKRVSFGPSNQQFYYDPHAENVYLDEMKDRKKKVFRGRRLLSGLFGRNRRSNRHDQEYNMHMGLNKNTTDMTMSNSLSSEWDENISTFDDPREPAHVFHQNMQQQPYFQSPYGGNYPPSQMVPAAQQLYQPKPQAMHPQQQPQQHHQQQPQQQMHQPSQPLQPSVQQQSYYTNPGTRSTPPAPPPGSYFPLQQQHQQPPPGIYYQ